MTTKSARAASTGSALRGIALMLLAVATLTCSDALTKRLGESYPPGQVICIRTVFTLVPAAVMVAFYGGLASLRVNNLRGQIKRSLAFVCSSTTIALSVILLPIADASAILFASPLFVTALAYPMLGERVGWQRWVAVLLGFCGVVIMLRPTVGAFQPLALVPISAALFAAIRDIYSRQLSRTETNNSMMVWSSVALIAISGLSGLVAWAPIGWLDLALMAATGCLIGVAQFMMLQAYRLAEAAVVAPMKYTGVVWASIVGYLVWHTLPDMFIVAGSALVISSGLYILFDETRRANRTPPTRVGSKA